jgi:hypothetical protein
MHSLLIILPVLGSGRRNPISAIRLRAPSAQMICTLFPEVGDSHNDCEATGRADRAVDATASTRAGAVFQPNE